MRRLAATAARSEQERPLAQAFDAGLHDFFGGAKLTYDPLVSFGVKQVAEIEAAGEEAGDPAAYPWGPHRELVRLERAVVPPPARGWPATCAPAIRIP